MAANVSPIFVGTVRIGQSGANNAGTILGPTANAAQDGTGHCYAIFQAGANGSFVRKVVLKPVLSPAATVARIFYCSATGAYTENSTNTATNTTPIAEISLPAITSSNTVAQNDVVIPIAEAMPANTWLAISFGTSTGSAGTGYAVTVFGGDY